VPATSPSIEFIGGLSPISLCNGGNGFRSNLYVDGGKTANEYGRRAITHQVTNHDLAFGFFVGFECCPFSFPFEMRVFEDIDGKEQSSRRNKRIENIF
jgi:hypothetical protein